jgi:hypothetical protein
MSNTWEVQCGGHWMRLDAIVQAELECALQAGRSKWSFTFGDWSYLVDFQKMTQTNTTTGKVRAIRINKPWRRQHRPSTPAPRQRQQATPRVRRPSTPGPSVTFYHGTSLAAASSIQASGFDVSQSGSNAGAALGPGVYITLNRAKAENYTHGAGGGVILHLSVRLGRCKQLKPGDDMTDWQQKGYDSAWAPAGTISPGRYKVILTPTCIFH